MKNYRFIKSLVGLIIVVCSSCSVMKTKEKSPKSEKTTVEKTNKPSLEKISVSAINSKYLLRDTVSANVSKLHRQGF
jgi:PBP1b-binding outer membrane lipoprotein LpoB